MQLPAAYPPLDTMRAMLAQKGRAASTIEHYCRLITSLCLKLAGPAAVGDAHAVAAMLASAGASSPSTRAQVLAAWGAYARAHPGRVAQPAGTVALPPAARDLLRLLRAEGLSWLQIAGLSWGDVGPGARYAELRLPKGKSLRIETEQVKPLADALGGTVDPTWQLFCGAGGEPTSAVDLKRLGV